MPFAEEFINAFLAGQQAKAEKQDYQHRQRKMLFEEEDRGIEKEVLQHRLRELKINQRLQARKAAEENLNFMSGIPESEVTPDMTEGGVLPARSATGDNSIQTLLKEMELPGIEELGIAGVKRRPQTLESQLSKTMAEARIKAMTTPYNLSPGQHRQVGGVDIASLPDRPQTPIGLTNRDVKGTETTEYVLPGDAVGRTTTRARLPSRAGAGGGGANRLSDEDRDANVQGIIAGRLPPQVPNSNEGLRIQAGLQRAGFDLKKANQDLRATRAHYQTLNGAQQSQIRIAADIAEGALGALEDVQAAWKSGGRGIFSNARLTLAKNGGLGPEAQQQAKDFEAAVAEVQQAIAVLNSNGGNPSNAAITAAANAINTGSNIEAAIKQLRKSLQYRIASVRNLEAITTPDVAPIPSGGGAAGDDVFGIGLK